MRVLVACEYSGVVREAFRAKGHEAYSCDLLPAEDGSPYHIQGNVLDVLEHDWDLMIAHPPCTYLCNSGWHWTVRECEQGVFDRYDNHCIPALVFFLKLLSAPIPKICVENPVPGPMLKGSVGSPTQYVQPYHFGDDASKKTGLWLKNLPPLSIPPEEEWYPPRIVDGKKRWGNQTDSGQNKLPPSEDRWKERSRTYAGIAKAFAEAWG